MNNIFSQFSKPRGVIGSVVGKIMANSNAELNRWAVSVLELQNDDNILEIGFGPGTAIAEMSQIAVNGSVLGIDYSEVMLKQAYKRNIGAIKNGRVELQVADISGISSLQRKFDKVLSVNSIMFWERPVETLRVIKTLMNPGGRIVIAAQVRERGPARRSSEQVGLSVVHYLTDAEYSEVRMYHRDIKPVPAVCVVGFR